MMMRPLKRLPFQALQQIALAALLTSLLTLGSPLEAANSPAADTAWLALQQLMLPLQTSALASKGISPAKRVAQEVSQFHRASLKANAFYLTYPTDSRVWAAHKLEAVAELQSVQLGGVQYQSHANAVASSYRTDPGNSVADRFDVALAMETVSLPASLRGTSIAQNGPVHQALADKLHGEFGDVPQVYGLYVSIIRTADSVTAQNAANTVLQASGAPDWAKTIAQQSVSRTGITGKPLSANLTTTSGQNLNLAPPSGQVTVVYFWTPETTGADLTALYGLGASMPSNLRWVYVSLGSSAAAPSLAVPFVGTFCTESQGFASANAKSLNITETPYVVVLSAQGKVVGTGHVQDLAALVHAASQ